MLQFVHFPKQPIWWLLACPMFLHLTRHSLETIDVLFEPWETKAGVGWSQIKRGKIVFVHLSDRPDYTMECVHTQLWESKMRSVATCLHVSSSDPGKWTVVASSWSPVAYLQYTRRLDASNLVQTSDNDFKYKLWPTLPAKCTKKQDWIHDMSDGHITYTDTREGHICNQ